MSNKRNNKQEVDLWKNLMRPFAESGKSRKGLKASILRLFLKTPTPLIADAMDGRNVINVRPVISGTAIAGSIVTVKTNPADWGTVVSAIESASPRDVLFIDSSGSDIAVWGGLTSRAAQQRRLAGTIVYGSCRDVPTIKALQYPVWVRGITARAGMPLNKGKVNVPINIAGVSVKPLDLAKADEHGAVVIPSNEIAAITNRVIEIIRKEHSLEKGIKDGRNLSEILPDFSS